MTDLNKNNPVELNENELDQVVGGHGVGDKVICSASDIVYCSKCGRLLKNYEATILDVRGVLDGKTVYFVQRGCCGSKGMMIETDIIG